MWLELAPYLRLAREDLVALAHDVVEMVPDGVVERKFKNGEAEYDNQWLEYSQDQIRNEYIEEMVDALVYLAMRRYLADAPMRWTDKG
jgi:hypothetical protein